MPNSFQPPWCCRDERLTSHPGQSILVAAVAKAAGSNQHPPPSGSTLLAQPPLLLGVACSCEQVATASQGSPISEIPPFSSCLSHLSPCCDKIPGEGSLREEGLIVACRSRVQPGMEGMHGSRSLRQLLHRAHSQEAEMDTDAHSLSPLSLVRDPSSLVWSCLCLGWVSLPM